MSGGFQCLESRRPQGGDVRTLWTAWPSSFGLGAAHPEPSWGLHIEHPLLGWQDPLISDSVLQMGLGIHHLFPC